MRFGDALLAVLASVLLTLTVPADADTAAVVHKQHYAMGTMAEIVVYHPSRADAMSAIDKAFAEIDRLERVMSHYRSDSDLSKLNREARHRPVRVDPSLHEILRESIEFSRRSRGRFDVTIAPLLRLWKGAAADGTRPSPEAIARARRCVGYEKIDLSSADGIRFHSECLEIDLGGIGKGYAVDRALAVLMSAGIRRAMINFGGSSIVAIGAPPGRDGWPVLLGQTDAGGTVLLLSGESVSTSQQDPSKPFGEIIDPLTGAPVAAGHSVSVIAPTATASDALSTTVLMLPVEEATVLLNTFPDVAAVWFSPDGRTRAAVRESRLRLQASSTR
jgi:FAD:protein FMN transferase